MVVIDRADWLAWLDLTRPEAELLRPLPVGSRAVEQVRYSPMARSATRRTAAALPERIRPQLTQLVQESPEGPEWLHEIKFDGYRMHTRLDRGAVRLLTRTGLDWTHKFRPL